MRGRNRRTAGRMRSRARKYSYVCACAILSKDVLESCPMERYGFIVLTKSFQNLTAPFQIRCYMLPPSGEDGGGGGEKKKKKKK